MEDWKSLRAKAIEMKHAFLDLADTLDLWYEKGKMVRAASSNCESFTVAGATVAVVAGMAATLTTYGLAAPIAATGAAVATAGSLTTLGVSVADYIAKKGIEYQWKEFKKQFSSLAQLPEVDATDIKMDELTCTLEEQKERSEESIGEFLQDIMATLGQNEAVGSDDKSASDKNMFGAVQIISKNLELPEDEVFKILAAVKDMAMDTLPDHGWSRITGTVVSQASEYVATVNGFSKAAVYSVFQFCNTQSAAIRDILSKGSADAIPDASLASGLGRLTGFLGGSKPKGMLERGYHWAQKGSGWLPPSTLKRGNAAYASTVSLAADVAEKGRSVLGGSKSLAYGLAQRGAGVANTVGSMIPETWMRAGSDVYVASKSVTSGLVQRGVGIAKAGTAYIPPTATNAGKGLYTASKGAMQGVVTKGWGLASQAKSWASGRWSGAPVASASKTAASAGGFGRGAGLVSAVSRPIVMFNAVLLPFSVMELVQISIELREKDESKKTKSKAGDLLRKLAEDLNQVIESTASQDTNSFLGPRG